MKKIFFIFSSASIFFLGIFTGIILENFRQSDHKIYDFSPKEISDPKIPVITFSQIENGDLKGRVENGEIRIQIESKNLKKTPASVIYSENFSLNIREILPMMKEIPHPKNTKFIASKRGKKFYPIDSPRAFLVTPKNRIFFFTQEEAEKKGFKKY